MTYPKGWPPTETTKVTWDTGGQVLKGLDEVSLASYVVGIARALVGVITSYSIHYTKLYERSISG